MISWVSMLAYEYEIPGRKPDIARKGKPTWKSDKYDYMLNWRFTLVLISYKYGCITLPHKWPDVMLFEKRYKNFVALGKKFLLYCKTTDLVLP